MDQSWHPSFDYRLTVREGPNTERKKRKNKRTKVVKEAIEQD